jgi:hypothetical protein
MSKIIDFFLLFAIQVNGAMNYREALRKAEQPQTSSLLNQILQTIRERFPGQSDDNLLTMILEVCKLSLFTTCFDEKRNSIFHEFFNQSDGFVTRKTITNTQTGPVAISFK